MWHLSFLFILRFLDICHLHLYEGLNQLSILSSNTNSWLAICDIWCVTTCALLNWNLTANIGSITFTMPTHWPAKYASSVKEWHSRKMIHIWYLLLWPLLCIPSCHTLFYTSKTHEQRFWLGSSLGSHHYKTLKEQLYTLSKYFSTHISLLLQYWCLLTIKVCRMVMHNHHCGNHEIYYIISADKCASVFDNWFINYVFSCHLWPILVWKGYTFIISHSAWLVVQCPLSSPHRLCDEWCD